MTARIYSGADARALVAAALAAGMDTSHGAALVAAAPDIAESLARHERIAAMRLARIEELADAYDRLVRKVWEAATGDTHEGPASTSALLDAVRRLREERDALKARSEAQS